MHIIQLGRIYTYEISKLCSRFQKTIWQRLRDKRLHSNRQRQQREFNHSNPDDGAKSIKILII